jgi:hypothetical protein
MEAGEDELQLAGIMVDVADGEEARHVGLELSCRRGSGSRARFRPHSAMGPSFMVRPKKGASHRRAPRLSSRRPASRRRLEVRALCLQATLAELQVHVAGGYDERASAHRVGRARKRRDGGEKGERLARGWRFTVQSRADRPRDDEDALVPERLPCRTALEHARALVGLDVSMGGLFGGNEPPPAAITIVA